jgi:hypothetical protein
MNFREWMDFGRASFLFQRVLKGLFPHGRLDKGKKFGVRTLSFNVTLNNRLLNFSLVEASEPYVSIDFTWDHPPEDAGLQAPTLQRGSIDFAHTMKQVVAAFGQVGLGVKFNPIEGDDEEGDESIRGRMYDRIVKKAGFNRIGPDYNYKPAKIA